MTALLDPCETVRGNNLANPKVICISGVGHCGSTVMAITLSNHPRIEYVGELHKVPRSGWTPNETRRCSCGQRVDQCDYWRQVYDRWTEHVGKDCLRDYVALQKRFERSRGAMLRLLYQKKFRTNAFIEYSHMTSALYRSLSEVSGAEIIADSSKNPVRAYAISLTNQIDLRVIHLIRDGRGMVWSYKKPRIQNIEAGIPTGRPPRSAWRSAFYWLRRNLETEWVLGKIGEERVKRVIYEDFVENPETQLQRLSELVGKDLTGLAELMANGSLRAEGHMGSGNHVRMNKSIVIRHDAAWRQGLSERDRKKFWLVAGRLAKRYGYQNEA